MACKPLCRLCVEEVEPLLDIFGNFGSEQQIAQMVGQHLWFEIAEDDPLSDKVCTVCWSKLVDFHTFYAQVQKAQDRITMVVIEEDKEEDDLPDDQGTEISADNNIDVDLESDAEQLQYLKSENLVAKAENYQNDDNYDDFNQVDSLSNQIKSDTHETEITGLTSHSFKNAPCFEISTQMDDTSESASAQDSNKTDDQLAQVTEILYDVLETSENTMTQSQEEADEIDTLPRYAKRTYTKRRQKRVASNGNDTQVELFNESPAKKVCRVKGSTRVGRKDSSCEQEKKQVGLIESYFTMRCDLCQEDFDQFQLLFEHYDKMHQLRGYIICCGKKFFRRPVIAEHVLWHTQPENFTCSTCDIVFSNKRSYDNHMLLHAPPDVKLYQCEHCPKTFAKKFKLDKHKLSHLKDDEKSHICDECDKPYASDALLRAHKRVVHWHTYAHMCEICAKVFKSRVFFEKHQLEHLGQNLPKVQCEICGVWLKNEHTMRAHMRNHEDEGQDHFCDICGKKGPSRNAITKHKRFVHLSERKFKCTFCDKAFKRAISLKEHMAVHTGEVLYTCSFCPKTFNSGANMHAHRKKVHPTEWFEDKQIKLESMKPNE